MLEKEKFTVTEEHLKLLKAMYVGWNDCEFGAPEIDPKRPYGNSDVINDMTEILGIDPVENDWDEKVYPKGTDARCQKLHKETQKVLQIVLATGLFKPGQYECEKYGRKWKPAA